MSEDRLVFNGIDAATGKYLLPPLTPHEVAKVAQGEKIDKAHFDELKARARQSKMGAHLGVKEGVDATNLAEAGWGVVFSERADPAVQEALQPLLSLRREQAAMKKECRYKEYTGGEGYHTGDSKPAFLARHGMGPGPANPDKVPYYLLIVGSPEEIPYTFQYQLDVQYAVGRIHFDTLDEYAQYACSVIAAEKGQATVPPAAAFFGVQNPDDEATKLSAKKLVKPLAEWFTQQHPDWTVQTTLQEQATKARLGELLGGSETPALLFTASHGMGFPKDDALQIHRQGALLCQDWRGPKLWGEQEIPRDFYFASDDVSDTARLQGLIAFHFACFGAGTPRLDDFAYQAFKERMDIAPRPFVAALPRRLLSHPKGGALAVIGHVDRAWPCSFMWERAGQQLTVFQDALQRLAAGHPVGWAMDHFNERYAELSSDLAAELEEIKFGKIPDDAALAGMWTANNDARSYVVIGDPAVRLPLAKPPAAAT